MIGLIQHTLMVLVEKHGGRELKEQVLRDCSLPAETRFPIHQDLPDVQCSALITVACLRLDLDEETLWRMYADQFLTEARQLFPRFFEMAPTARDFLIRQPTIHCTFGAGLRDAAARDVVRDKFFITEDGPDLLIRYRSNLQLCRLYCALAEAVLELYAQPGSIVEEECRHDSHQACLFRITFHDSTSESRPTHD